MSMELVVVKCGEVYKCLYCKDTMYKATKEMVTGNKLDASYFFNVQLNKPALQGEQVQCQKCGIYPLRAFLDPKNWSEQ